MTHLKGRITLTNVFDRQTNALIKKYIRKQTLNIKRNQKLPTGRLLVEYRRKRVTCIMIVINSDLRLKKFAEVLI